MFELFDPAISIAATALLAWSGFRARYAENRFVGWGGAALAALRSTVVALMSVLLIVGLFKLHARSAPAVALKIAGTPELIRRGQEISEGFCSGCHSKTGTLTGGNNIG